MPSLPEKHVATILPNEKLPRLLITKQSPKQNAVLIENLVIHFTCFHTMEQSLLGIKS